LRSPPISTTAKSRIATNLHDLGEDESAIERIFPCPELAAAVRDADYVIEAVSEDLSLKQKLFAEIERHVRDDTILASNTSVIPITSIMQGLKRRERALGTHWWNPPFLVPLVEVIETQWTKPQAVAWTMALHADAGKQPAHVKKDVPGFIGNRLQHALWREAISLVEHGICDAETVDMVVKASFRTPFAGARPAGECRSGRHRSHALRSTISFCRRLIAGPSHRPISESSWPRRSSVSNPARVSRKWTAAEQATLRANVMKHLKSMRNA